jgi:hypothetical protein
MPLPQLRAAYVLIASPGDLPEERDLVERVLHGWNVRRTKETGVVLLPRRWETGSVPLLGEGDAQSVINRQLVNEADIVFAFFYSRLGSATDRAVSGTAEEIERSVKNRKPVHLYFSGRPLPPEVDMDQLGYLREFKTLMEKQGLVGIFKDDADLKKLVESAIDHDIVRFERTPQEVERNSSWPALQDTQALLQAIRRLTLIQRSLLDIIYNFPPHDDGSDGADNGIYLSALKDKLGTPRNRKEPTSAEIAYRCKDLMNADLIEIDETPNRPAYYYPSRSVMFITENHPEVILKLANARGRTP